MKTKEKINDLLHTAWKKICHWLRAHWDKLIMVYLILSLILGGYWFHLRHIGAEEAALRQKIVLTAQSWLGRKEADGGHHAIVDLYNTQDPLPRDYTVTYEDNWCATFASAAALQAGMGDIIPMECSCEQQINLFRDMGRWRENECYLPRTGDYIYYVWDEWRRGDCTAWANHVGIVVDTFGPVIQVIEGNKDDQVAYRYLFLNDITIRGYGLPDYKNNHPEG